MPDHQRSLIFVLGVPRSGTTVVASLLGSHPRVEAPPEPWAMLLLESLGTVHPLHPAGPELVARRASALLAPQRRDAVLRHLAEASYARLAERPGARFLADKTPRYHLLYERLYRVFPDARYVFVLRDPAAIAASMRRAWGSDILDLLARTPGHPLCVDLFVGLPRLVEAIGLAPPRSGCVVRYEELVADPAGQARRLFDSLGIETSESELRAALALPRKSIDAEFGAQEIRATTGILAPPARAGDAPQWREAVAEALGPGLVHALGYPPVEVQPSPRPDTTAPLSAASLTVCHALLSKLELMAGDLDASSAAADGAWWFADLRAWLLARAGQPTGADGTVAMDRLGLAPSYLTAFADTHRSLAEKETEIGNLAAAAREKDEEIRRLAGHIDELHAKFRALESYVTRLRSNPMSRWLTRLAQRLAASGDSR